MTSINDLATAAIASSTTQPGGAEAGAAPAVDGVLPEAPASTAESSGAVRGALVVLEGMDRSGKTTQVKLLEQRFVELGKKVKVMRFPGECLHQIMTTLGSLSRQ